MKQHRITTIIVFCGIPGCGKSTIAKHLANQLKKREQVKLFVSDDIKGRVYKKVPTILKKHIGETDFIILDATFYKEKWRAMVYRLAKPHPIFLVYAYCKKQTAIERNRKRRPKIPEKVIHIMASQFETPKSPSISINTDLVRPTSAVKKVLQGIHYKRK